MATAAVAVPSHVPLKSRRATDTGPQTVPVHYPLTGFLRIEEGCTSINSSTGKRPAPGLVGATSSKKAAASSKTTAASSKGCSRWLYGVLLPGKLQLYARRTDYKRKSAPSDEIVMQVHATSANESVFGFDHECVYIRCKDTGRVVTVRIHQKKEIVRWVTALYYQSFSSDNKSPLAATAAANSKHDSKHDSKRPPEPGSAAVVDADAAARTKRKSVSFHDVPDVLVLPRESVDPAELFYSVREYEQFQQRRAAGSAANGDDDDDDDDDDRCDCSADAPPKKKKNLARLMKSIYAKTAAKLRVSHKRSSMEQLR